MDLGIGIGHIAAFVLGVATWLPFTLWEGRKMNQLDDLQDSRFDPPETPRPRLWQRPVTLPIVAVLVGCFFVGLGVQQLTYQHGQEQDEARSAEQLACVRQWGKDFRAVTRTRVAANVRVEEVRRAKDDALDNVVLFIISTRAADPPPPPKVAERGFTRVLQRFAVAKSDLTRAEQRVQTTRNRNPYPHLRCGA